MTEITTQAKTAVIYHSGYGHTACMASAIAESAGVALAATDAEDNIAEDAWATLARVDTILFGSPTYMGGPNWQFKKFVDASSKPWFGGMWQNRVFGGFTNSASINDDKLNMFEYFILFTGQHDGIWVNMDIKPASVKASKRDDLNHMGSYITPMAQAPTGALPEEMSTGNLETARRCGARVTMVAAQLHAERTDVLK